jgi:alkylation response protein AidB-like acyl-CoA dehydrogenase
VSTVEELDRVANTKFALEQIVRTDGRHCPEPGGGRTWDRFAALATWSAADLSLGRLAEGHVDALAILAESGRGPAAAGAIYGVWAARSGAGGTTARLESDGWHLSGHKPFCSGAGLADRALVTADTPDGYRLFDIAVPAHVVERHPDSWPAVGMADSQSETLEFGGPALDRECEVGGPGFYLERPGFWFGAVGVAACWYGGAAGLTAHLTASLNAAAPDVVLAELGRAVAHVGSMRALLHAAAGEIDADPLDLAGRGRSRALVVRDAVRHGATEVLGHVAAAGGARPLCLDRAQSQRAADLYAYLAQHHGPQDAAALGRAAVEGVTWC